MRHELTWHDRAADLPEALWHDCFGPPHEGLFWYRAIEAGTLAGQFRFMFGLLQQDGIGIGIVPAFLFDFPLQLVVPGALARVMAPLAVGPLRRFAFQRTLFVGSVAGEEGHVGLVPGHTLQELAPFVHDQLRAKARELNAPMLIWKDFPNPDRIALDSLLGTRRGFRMVSYPGTAIPLVSGGYTSFLATLRSERRWKINDKLRRGEKKVGVITFVIAHPGSIEVDEIFSLYLQTYARGKTKFERLTPEFFHSIAACRESTFITLRDPVSGKMLAFMLLFDLGQRVINQFIGIDYAAGAGGFLYFRLFAAAYDWACTTRATVLLSGQTGYMAKLDMGHELVPLWNYGEHRNPILNLICRRFSRAVSWESLDAQLGEYLMAHPEARVPG